MLSSPDLNAPALSDLRWGKEQRRVSAADVTTRDVNGDGRADLLLTGTADELGLKLGTQVLCATGGLPDDNSFISCVPITLAPAPERTPGSADPTQAARPSDAAQPTDGPSVQAASVRGPLAGSGGPRRLMIVGGAVITAVAIGVLIAAPRLRARS